MDLLWRGTSVGRETIGDVGGGGSIGYGVTNGVGSDYGGVGTCEEVGGGIDHGVTGSGGSDDGGVGTCEEVGGGIDHGVTGSGGSDYGVMGSGGARGGDDRCCSTIFLELLMLRTSLIEI